MNYTNIKRNGYNLHLIKTDNFKTIKIRVNFRTNIEESLITKRELLAGILTVSSKKYPRRKDMVFEKEKLYQLVYSATSLISGNAMLFSIETKFIHEKYTEDGMNKKSIEFFLDSLMNPNINNECFDKETFNLEKRNYMEFLEGINDNPNMYASNRLDELRGRFTSLSYNRSGNIDVLKKLDEYELYKVYKNMIENDILDIFVVGDIDDDLIESLLDNYLEKRSLENKKMDHFFKYPVGDNIIIKEKSNFKQSKLKMGYYASTLTQFERKYVLPVYNFLLGGSSDSLLFRNIREEHSLCYDINSVASSIYGMITISAGIEAKDYEKTVSLIKENVKKMQDGDFPITELEKVKLNYKTSYEESLDSQNSILNLYESLEYLNYDLIEERKKQIDKVTKDMVIKLAKKIKLDVIYLLEGNDIDE
jgi:predicted Zn-dependent peptidase